MSSNNPIQTNFHQPPLPPAWVKGMAYTSALALAATTVALTTLLYLYQQMGLVSFSLLGGGEALAFLATSLGFYRLHQKEKEPEQPSISVRVLQPAESAQDELSPNLSTLPVHEEENVPPPVEVELAQPIEEVEEIDEPDPINSLAYIETFRTSLPQVFTAIDDLLVAFVTQYSISEGKKPKQKEVDAVHGACQELTRVVDAILQDKKQLFRFTLGAFATEFLEDETLFPFLAGNRNPQAFVQKLPELLSGKATDAARELFGMIAEGAQLAGHEAELQKRYQELCAYPAKVTQARLAADQAKAAFEAEKIDYKKLQKAGEALEELETAYHGALMGLVDWLFFTCEVDEAKLEEIVADNVPFAIEKVRQEILGAIPNLLYTIQEAYDEEGVLSTKLAKAAIWFATTFHKAIRKPIISQIMAFPLDPKYSRPLCAVVNDLVPALTYPIFYATVGDKSKFSRDPHPFRVALVKKIFGTNDFLILRENPESDDCPGYALVLAQLFHRFTNQLNELFS